jgi:hypothetical protein
MSTSVIGRKRPFYLTKEWSQLEAIAFAIDVEHIARSFNFHVGLTGGCLYRQGLRKDCDLVFYPHVEKGCEPNELGLIDALVKDMNLILGKRFTRVQKSTYFGRSVDLIFPHHTPYGYDDEIASE